MKYKEIKNLYEKLLPEIKYNLKKNSITYSHSVKSIIAKLHVYKYYGEMTIDEVKTLITYSDIDIEGDEYNEAHAYIMKRVIEKLCKFNKHE